MFDNDALVRLSQDGGGVIVIACAVGDTLVDGTILLNTYRCQTRLPEQRLRNAIHLDSERTFAQDPKYPIRLLVDIESRRCLRQLMIRRPRFRPLTRSKTSCDDSAEPIWTLAALLTRMASCGWLFRSRLGKII